MNCRTVYSLKELHDLLEKHEEKHRLCVFIDLDLTIIKSHDENEEIDVLIEPEVTKELFNYMVNNNIYFAFITGRFYDTVCVAKKRNLREIEKNIFTSIFPILEELGLDISQYKDDSLRDEIHIVRNDRKRCIGILYRGIFFTGNKGETIKQYKKSFNLNDSHPITIFIDDHDPYLRSVAKHVPDAVILKRNIEY